MTRGSKARPPSYLVGRRFRKFVVTGISRHVRIPSGGWRYYATCACDCGGVKEVLTASLVRGSTGSCGCDKSRYLKTTGKNNVGFKGHGEIRRHFWRGYVTGALNRNIPFKITIEYAWSVYEAQGGRCALSGDTLVFGTTRISSHTTASIDRIDNLQGYVEGNIQWVHKRINIMRNTLSSDEFISWCEKVVDHAKVS